MKKAFLIGCFVSLAACRGGTDSGTISSSSSSSTSGGSSSGKTGSSGATTSNGGDPAQFECPNVGDKLCPNDDPVTQSAVDTCDRCNSEYSAYFACVGAPSCGPDGKTSSSTKSGCDDQQAAVVQCALSDGGR